MSRTWGRMLLVSAMALPGAGRKGIVPRDGAKFCMTRPLIKRSMRERHRSRCGWPRCAWEVARDHQVPCRRHSPALRNPRDRLTLQLVVVSQTAIWAIHVHGRQQRDGLTPASRSSLALGRHPGQEPPLPNAGFRLHGQRTATTAPASGRQRRSPAQCS